MCIRDRQSTWGREWQVYFPVAKKLRKMSKRERKEVNFNITLSDYFAVLSIYSIIKQKKEDSNKKAKYKQQFTRIRQPTLVQESEESEEEDNSSPNIAKTASVFTFAKRDSKCSIVSNADSHSLLPPAHTIAERRLSKIYQEELCRQLSSKTYVTRYDNDPVINMIEQQVEGRKGTGTANSDDDDDIEKAGSVAVFLRLREYQKVLKEKKKEELMKLRQKKSTRIGIIKGSTVFQPSWYDKYQNDIRFPVPILHQVEKFDNKDEIHRPARSRHDLRDTSGDHKTLSGQTHSSLATLSHSSSAKDSARKDTPDV
eukprot:TRINITY_DN13777_c0_g1_i1.p1 TRINITY_DN13777_c0_g1~~TRINITY_DN13777_c0_g1_i1.p1  ORF type:complete len:313 (+),score=51.83 TRINITY_DN13777_c0_g1_i1:64-1002(+)